MCAAQGGHVELLRFLASCRVDLNLQTEKTTERGTEKAARLFPLTASPTYGHSHLGPLPLRASPTYGHSHLGPLPLRATPA